MPKHNHIKYILILGQPYSRHSVIVTVVCLCLVIVLPIILLYALAYKNSQGDEPATFRTPPVKEPPVQVDSSAAVIEAIETHKITAQASTLANPLEQILKKHMRATRLDQVNSLIADGFFAKAQNEYTIVLMARAPNFYKLKTENQDSGETLNFGYDSEQVWLDHSNTDLKTTEKEIYLSTALLESSLPHVAWSYRSPQAVEAGLNTVLSLMPSETWKGEEYHVIQSHGLLPITIEHFIDPKTYLEVRRRTKVTKPDGAILEISLDYMPPSGETPYDLPSGYTLNFGGALHGTVNFDEFRINRVILTSPFKAPGGMR